MDGFLHFLVVELRGIPPCADIEDSSNIFNLDRSELIKQLQTSSNPHKLHAPDPPQDDHIDSILTIPQNFLPHMSLIPYLHERLMYFSVALCIDATLFDLTIAPLQTFHLLINLIFPNKMISLDENHNNCNVNSSLKCENNEVKSVENLNGDQIDYPSSSSRKDSYVLETTQPSLFSPFPSQKSIGFNKILHDENESSHEFIEMSDSNLYALLPEHKIDVYDESFGSNHISEESCTPLHFKSSIGDEFSECNLTNLSQTSFTDVVKDVSNKIKDSNLFYLKDEFKHFISFEDLRNNNSNTSIESGIGKLYDLSEFFNSQPSVPECIGAMRFLVIILSFLMFSRIDTSRVYHYIRGQPFIKLYVIFNMLEIFERLCRTLGRDLFDLLSKSLLQCLETFNKNNNNESTNFTKSSTNYYLHKDNPININDYHLGKMIDRIKCVTETNIYKWMRFGFIFLIVTLHSLIHTFMHLIRVMSLNIALNSSEGVMFLLLVTNNFAELKSSVFKKYSNVSLFMISASDSVERFHFFSDAFLVFLKMSTSYRKFKNSYFSVSTWLISVLLVEIVVDWCKLAFMVKFNRINSQSIYRYHEALVADTLLSRVTEKASDLISFNFFVPCKSVFNYSHIPPRRLNFSSIPFVVLVLCSLPKISFNIWGIIFMTEIWMSIILAKVLTSILLVAFVIKNKGSLKQLYPPFDKVDST